IVGEIAKNVSIPVFGAGGVMTPEDATRMLDLGATGVQMGSRFIASEECEVDQFFKEMYIKAEEGDVLTIMSSAGLPANAIRSPYVEKIIEGTEVLTPKSCHRCLKKCSLKFCVNESLRKGHSGNYDEGIFFAGKEVHRIKEILTVKEIFRRFAPVFQNA
ncbi:nitronate monooxygenase, partial [Cetobacterium sp. 2A]